jgi:hypothetical protein
MVSIVRFSIFELGGRQAILAGADNGQALLAKLVAQTPRIAEATPCYLDFSGIAVATFSFIRESVFAYRDYARASMPALYPVVANAESGVLEEIWAYARSEADVIWTCRLDRRGILSNVRLAGSLDPIQKQTLDLVCRLGSADAPGLAKKDRSIGVTGWNNRLATLNSKGLLIEQRAGKAKIFKPVLGVA